MFGPLKGSDLSVTKVSCVPGPCVVSTNSNITLLQWKDLKRTLTFAWDLHVYGSAVLFSSVVVIAIFGIIGGTHMLHSWAFILANILLLLAGLLRLVLFIIDPYGTRNIMPRPTLTAFYNLPVTLLLWAQVTLALFSLRQERLGLQTSPQQLSLTGGLAVMHCTSILIADLLSKTMSPALPLMLQTLTICWGLPLCLGIFFQSLQQLRPSHRTPLPRWSTSKRAVNVRRVLLLCGLLGVLSCALQIYGFLWLYGLLGDWQRFGWGWWVVQLCARLLELAWSFSLLLLGSRVFWRPQGTHGKHRKETTRRAQKGKEMSQVNTMMERLPMGPWGKPDRNWAELLPNNWKGQQQSRGNVNHLTDKNEETPAVSVTTVQDSTGNISGDEPYSSRTDCHAAPLWTSGVEWQEHECFLSLIEFDHCPPSHVNLSSALHHAHLLGVGTIFAPSPPSWDQNEGPFESNIISPIPTNRAYRWTLDPCSSPVPTHHFGSAVQQTHVSVIEPLESLTPETIRRVWERDTTIPRIIGDDDGDSIASGDDVTSL